MGAVFKIDLPPSEKVVALALADHAHDDGTEARPSIERLASKTSLSTRQVQRVVKSLVEKGVLVVQRHATSTQPVCYRFPLTASGVIEIGGDKLSGGDISGDLGVTSGALGGDTGVTLTVIEPPVEPSSLLLVASAERPRRTRDEAIEEQFKTLWAIYPRKVGKTEALKAYRRRVHAGSSPAEMFTATVNFAEHRRGEDPAFTMYASRFYGSSEPWRDYLDGGAGLVKPARRLSPIEVAKRAEESMAFVQSLFGRPVDRPVADPVVESVLEHFTLAQLGRMSREEVLEILRAKINDTTNRKDSA